MASNNVITLTLEISARDYETLLSRPEIRNLIEDGRTLSFAARESRDEAFGRVEWVDEDIRNALEVGDYPVTDENVSIIRSKLSKHWFTDAMIECGWEYIHEVIRQELERPEEEV